jgi:hypothetical protein
MEGIVIDVSQSCTGADRYIEDVYLYANADNPVTVSGVPSKPGNCSLTAVKLVLVNADGVEFEVSCLKTSDGFVAVVPKANLAKYGEIDKGLRVMATGSYGGITKDVCLGIAKLCIVSDAAWAEPGTGSGVSGVMKDVTLDTATLADLKSAVKQIGSVLGATVL